MRATVTAQEMAAHVAAVCRRAKVRVSSHSSGGRAWRKSSRIAIRPVKGDITYAIALHELGHVLGEQKGKRIDHEVQAWQWARRHAIVWTDAMKAKEAASLASYARWMGRRPSSTPKYPETAAYLAEVLRGEF